MNPQFQIDRLISENNDLKRINEEIKRDLASVAQMLEDKQLDLEAIKEANNLHIEETANLKRDKIFLVGQIEFLLIERDSLLKLNFEQNRLITRKRQEVSELTSKNEALVNAIVFLTDSFLKKCDSYFKNQTLLTEETIHD